MRTKLSAGIVALYIRRYSMEIPILITQLKDQQ
jgi:hypothetical protein